MALLCVITNVTIFLEKLLRLIITKLEKYWVVFEIVLKYFSNIF